MYFNVKNFNSKIDFLTAVQPTGAVDNLEPSYTTTIQSVWARKIRLLSSEAIKFGMDYNTIRVNFIIRKRKDIAEDMFIKHENTIYNIIGYEGLSDDVNFMLIATVRKQVIA